MSGSFRDIETCLATRLAIDTHGGTRVGLADM